MSKAKVKVEKDGAERWLLTYADLMNLLVIFFIVLYSMSQVDTAKFNQLASSLKQSLGISSSNTYVMPSGGANSLVNLDTIAPSTVIPSKVKIEEAKMEDAKAKLDELLKTNNLTDNIKVTVEERGVKISITSHYLFSSGSAQLEKNSKPTIEEIGKTLLGFNANHIRIEGHTDVDPINTPMYPSNWELSSARASTVLRLLTSKVGINPKNISAVGYSEYHPEYPNDTEENKAKNRRVDIVILKDDFSKAEVGSLN